MPAATALGFAIALCRTVDRGPGTRDRRLEVSPSGVRVQIRREDASGPLLQTSLNVLLGRSTDMAPLAFVPDGTAAQSQEGFGLVGPDEDRDLMQLASVRIDHHHPNRAEGEKEGDGGSRVKRG
jgi:hypothetical protein